VADVHELDAWRRVQQQAAANVSSVGSSLARSLSRSVVVSASASTVTVTACVIWRSSPLGDSWGFTLAEADSYCYEIVMPRPQWPRAHPQYRDRVFAALRRIGVAPLGSGPLWIQQLQASASELPPLLVQVFRIMLASLDELTYVACTAARCCVS
jgi:hypothetical protein